MVARKLGKIHVIRGGGSFGLALALQIKQTASIIVVVTIIHYHHHYHDIMLWCISDGESVAVGDNDGHVYVLGVVETSPDDNQLSVDVIADWQVSISEQTIGLL